MSGREARREQRSHEEDQAGAADRRQKLIKLASAAAFLALATVAVLIVLSQSQNSGGDTQLEGVAEVKKALAGIPQNGMVLGKPGAKASVLEFADLQCPFCKGYSEEVLPQVIERRVRNGEAKIDFRNYTIIGAGVDARGRCRDRRRRAGTRLEFRRALLPQPGHRGHRLRHRRVPHRDSPGCRGARYRQVEQRSQEQARARPGRRIDPAGRKPRLHRHAVLCPRRAGHLRLGSPGDTGFRRRARIGDLQRRLNGRPQARWRGPTSARLDGDRPLPSLSSPCQATSKGPAARS